MALIRPKDCINSYYLKYILESNIGKSEFDGRIVINLRELFKELSNLCDQEGYTYNTLLAIYKDMATFVNSYKGNEYTFLNTLKGRAISFASLLFVFVILALLIPNSFKNVGDEKASFTGIVTYIGYALVFLILVPVASLILMMLIIGLPVALMMIGLYIAAIYLSYAYMGYYLGKKIWLSKNKEENIL